jgi:hypothetical protein
MLPEKEKRQMSGGATKAEQARRACHTEIVVNNKGWSCNGARVGNLFQEEVAVFEGQCQPRHIASVAVEILLVCIRCGEHNLERQILAQEFLVLLRRICYKLDARYRSGTRTVISLGLKVLQGGQRIDPT